VEVDKLLQPLQNKRKEREVYISKVVEDTASSSKHQLVVNDKYDGEPLKTYTVLRSTDEKVDTSFSFALENVTNEIVHGEISNNNLYYRWLMFLQGF
jgi:hypothetical protein